MVSRRYRDKNSVGTRLNSLQAAVDKAAKGKETVTERDLAENSVNGAAIQPGSILPEHIQRGAVGTNELGVVNRIVTDNLLGIDGAGYAKPPAGSVTPLAYDSDGNVVATTGADSVLPAGSILAWVNDTAPANWLLADGSAISRTTYASLFTAIGTKFGVGDGTTTFNLPNLKGRVVVGKNAADTDFDVIGDIGGAKTHTLVIGEIPGHTHQEQFATNAIATGGGSSVGGMTSAGGAGLVGAQQSTLSAGGNGAHNNLQPYFVMNYIIKASNGDTPGDSALTARVSAVESVPIARLTKASSQSTSATPGTPLTVSWSADSFSSGMWSSGANTKIFPNRIGKWRVIGKARAGASSGSFYGQVRLNGANNSPAENLANESVSGPYIHSEDIFIVNTAGTDYFEFVVHSTVASIAVIPANSLFTAEWIGY